MNFLTIVTIVFSLANAFFAFKFAQHKQWNFATTLLFCVLAASVGTVMYLPTIIVMFFMLMRKQRR